MLYVRPAVMHIESILQQIFYGASILRMVAKITGMPWMDKNFIMDIIMAGRS